MVIPRPVSLHHFSVWLLCFTVTGGVEFNSCTDACLCVCVWRGGLLTAEDRRRTDKSKNTVPLKLPDRAVRYLVLEAKKDM